MRHDILLVLNGTALRLCRPRREVIVMLLMRLMRDITRLQGAFTLVKYQKRNPEKVWHCVPVSFRRDENEFFSDLRKLTKFSVSFLVAMATEMYLEELLQGDKRHNNTQFVHYAIGQRIENGIICWEMYWGNPKDTPKVSASSKIHRRTASL